MGRELARQLRNLRLRVVERQLEQPAMAPRVVVLQLTRHREAHRVVGVAQSACTLVSGLGSAQARQSGHRGGS